MKRRKEQGAWSMQALTAAISMAMVLTLMGTLALAALATGNLERYVKERIGITVSLAEDTREPEALKLERELAQKPWVKGTKYISKQQALEEQTAAMGTDPAEFLGFNPFAPSIELTLQAEYANPDSIARMAEEIKKEKRVTEVDYPQDLLEAVNRNLRKAGTALLALAALLGMVSFALINNTVRMSIYDKRFIIHTMKLVGAGWGFIRKPFVGQGMRTGLLAGAAADTMLATLTATLLKYEPQLGEVITTHTLAAVMAAVPVMGMALAGACAAVSVNRFLKMRGNEVYYY